MESSFKFKQFTVINGKSGLKVGTDGVLLGAATTVNGDEKRILDIGTGTGVIALMLAQRTADTRITGIDIEEEVTAEETPAANGNVATVADAAQVPAKKKKRHKRKKKVIKDDQNISQEG